MNSGQQNVIVNDGTIDQVFIANKTGNNSIAMEKKVNVQNSDRHFKEKIGSETSNMVDTIVKKKIKSAIFTD